ncbi:MAG: hypothetical protein WAK24_15445, partial [Candidatus Acidiferrales bacterium]
IAAHRPPKETAGLRNAGVCAKGIKKELKTLDVADFVRDVENRGGLNGSTQHRPEVQSAGVSTAKFRSRALIQRKHCPV